ncbi:RNA recognition motif 2-domain-containing protein [Glomus cerebriforme]|uniref:RNA recognition motif 2-domain-containing protein n=1 Tax=Glomus cerebriforme TaxID=658196 RepID=A0A397SX47_9GLOM|nr:RNA recognition motif 2-domain-containing protein [Glomus cerebriforme]
MTAHNKSNNNSLIKIGLDVRTTFMIRNIPNKYTQEMLIAELNETHKGKYDFLYLRIDFANKCNVGYAFINFVEISTVLSFAELHVGRKWTCFNSNKICELSYANVQGYPALVDKFRTSSTMRERPEYRPKVFFTSGPMKGMEAPFPYYSGQK